jgi:ATP-dependent DNA ligase
MEGDLQTPGRSPGLFCFRWVAAITLFHRGQPIEVRKATLASILRKSRPGVQLNEHLVHDCGLTVFQHACKMGLEGIVSKRPGSRYRSGRSTDWLKFKNPDAPAVRREAEEDWGR